MTLAGATSSPHRPRRSNFEGRPTFGCLAVRAITTTGNKGLESEKGGGRIKYGSLGILKIALNMHLARTSS